MGGRPRPYTNARAGIVVQPWHLHREETQKGENAMHVNDTIKQLTLEEKAALLQGWSTWTTWDGSKKGIPPIFLSDGPHGLRNPDDNGRPFASNVRTW